jgi:hypothetical protein
MTLKPAAEYLAQYNIELKYDNTAQQEAKFPYKSFEDKKGMKGLEDVIKSIRPNYPEYKNTTSYTDEHCRVWVHVCDASLEKGITPVKYIAKPH